MWVVTIMLDYTQVPLKAVTKDRLRKYMYQGELESFSASIEYLLDIAGADTVPDAIQPENKVEIIKLWLENNNSYLEMKPGGKKYSAPFVNKKFKEATGCMVCDAYMSQIMTQYKDELLEKVDQP